LIAREMGVVITGENGDPLDAPLSLDANVGWVGYANQAIKDQMEPALQAALRKRGLI
jgi:hypothetical protein